MKIKRLTFLIASFAVILYCQQVSAQIFSEGAIKIGRALSLIDAFYVDSININKISDQAIINILRELDPHSVYIAEKDVRDMNEPLMGNFEGIGIQFNILHDSIIVVEPLSGGPSEKVGLRSGDRILTINNEKVTGISISISGVRSRLMGKKGTTVNLTIFRKGQKDLLEFTVIRDKIPINSLDAAYMLNKETGYVRFNKFATTTVKEFDDAVIAMKGQKMKNLVIDLRDNGGGVMVAATDLANEFFEEKKMLVYLIGRKTPRQDYYSTGSGKLSSTHLVVLTDEESASASEIFAGAIQDWDRGVVIGRRTFGKGLVQNGFYLTDGSMIRLTVARYYTPTGRLIQSPYTDGYDKYMENFVQRYSDGELLSADSIHFPDSLKYSTLVSKRTVYGGGGIMPDIFIPADTTGYSEYYSLLVRKAVFSSFVAEYADKNRNAIKSKYPSFDDYKQKFEFSPDEIKLFISKGEEVGVKYVENQYKKSENDILLVLKALVANTIWQTNEYFRIVNVDDKVIDKALEILSDPQQYNTILGIK